jgi:hypothetical protein
MSGIATLLTALNGAVGVSREIGRLAKKIGNSEINERVIDLQGRVIDIQGMVSELIAEKEVLQKRITEYENVGHLARELKLEETVYWKYQDGKRIDGPLCPNCWDSQSKRVHLTPYGVPGAYRCGVCKSTGFHTADYNDPPTQVVSGLLTSNPRLRRRF